MLSIGNELKDSFNQTHNWTTNNINFISDIEQFYKQRSIIESQYSQDLLKLTNEFQVKRANKSIQISVGDEPKITPGSLESATLSTWNEILSQTELISQNHLNLSNQFNSFIINDLIILKQKINNLNEKILNFYNNDLINGKNEFFNNVIKSKKLYDDSCNSMEQIRLKIEKNSNKSSKLNEKFNSIQIEMNNLKNNYLLNINIANRIKDKFYYQDLPEILDLFQDLIEFKTKKLNQILNKSCNLEINKNLQNNENLLNSISIIKENNSKFDIQMFINHNKINNWLDPKDFYFIPSSIWHDDELFTINNNNELNHLKTILLKANQSISKYDSILESTRENLNQLQIKRNEIKSANELDSSSSSSSSSFEFNTSIDLLNNYLNIFSKFLSNENIIIKSQVEIESIENNASNFDLSLDGLVISKPKKGFLGKLTGSKPKETIIDTNNNNNTINTFDDSNSIRSNVTNSSTGTHTGKSKFHIPSLRRHKQTQSIDNNNGNHGNPGFNAIVNYSYNAQDDDELSISINEELEILNNDDNGWTLVRNSNGNEGIVPTSYIKQKDITTTDTTTTTTTKKKGPIVSPKKNGKKIQYVIANFDFISNNNDELNIKKGDKIKILQNDDGSGWSMGEINGYKGLFPTSYVETLN